MTRNRKILTYAVGFAAGCLILFLIPRDLDKPAEHKWHAQTAPEGYYPLEWVDDLGREVVLQRQPRWLISLAPSVTEMLFAMDMGDHLMAVTRWDAYPEEARQLRDLGASVGEMDRPDRELIAQYGPDLVLASDLTPPDQYSLIEAAARSPVVVLRHEGLEDLYSDVANIGRLLGVPGKALQMLNGLREAVAVVDEKLESVRGREPRRVLLMLDLETGLQPGWSPGDETWPDDLIRRAHGVNVASRVGKVWGQMSLESVVVANPNVILLQDGRSEESQATLRRMVESMRAHPVWQEVEAVRENRIFYLPPGPMSIPGPRIVEAYAAIAEGMWPEIFLSE